MMSSDSIPVRRGPKPNLKGNPDTNVYVSVMAQFSKDTYLFLKLSRSKSKTPIIIFIYCAKVFKVLGNIVVIINKPTRSTFGPLGSGRLPETPGMRHFLVYTTQSSTLYKSIAHRVPKRNYLLALSDLNAAL